MRDAGKVLIAGEIFAMVVLVGVAAATGSYLQFSMTGNNVTITGSTNLAAGDRLFVDVISAEFTPTVKGGGAGFSGASGTVIVEPGTPLNRYRFEFNVSAFSPGLYYVTVKSVETPFRDSGQFVLPWTPVPTVTPSPPADVTTLERGPSPAVTSPHAPHGSPTQTPLPGIVSLGAAITAAVLLLRRRRT